MKINSHCKLSLCNQNIVMEDRVVNGPTSSGPKKPEN